jgi:hypothetical protein
MYKGMKLTFNQGPSGKTRQRQKSGKGPENIGTEKIGEKSEKIGKTRQTLKNT